MFYIFSSSAPATFLTYKKIRIVGIVACVASCASLGQWWYMFTTRVICACAMDPMSVGLLRNSAMCSILICVALSFIGVYSRSISVVDLCITSVEKLEVRPRAFLDALSKSLSIVSSCLSLSIPKWMAWYLDLRNWSITSLFG
jgi:hypothetical protein